MKRFLQWAGLTALVCSLMSCGLPGAVGRTGLNAVKGLSNLIPSATGKLSSSGS